MEVLESIRIEKVLGSIKYKDWAFASRAIGEFCVVKIEYKEEVFAPITGVSKKPTLKYSEPFLVKNGSQESDILFAAITAIGNLEKQLMMDKISYKGIMLRDYYLTSDALKKIIERS